MRPLFFTLALALTPALSPAADPPELPLWPGKVPGEAGNVGEEKFVEPAKPEATPIKRLTNVTKPTITVYSPAKEKNTGAAIVVAPGGGYSILAWEHEGTQVAEWLRDLGVTAVLLKYRVPRRPDQPKDQPPLGALQDAQRAISMTRGKAQEWGIDPARVGMLGFSAGGHLTAWAATNSDKRSYDAVDDADKESCRPDFVIPIYPGGLLAKGSKDQLAQEIRVTKETPPAFLAVSADDRGSLGSTLALMTALKEAGVNAELHVFASGGHGFGMRAGDKPFNGWTKRVEEWLKERGYLTAKK